MKLNLFMLGDGRNNMGNALMMVACAKMGMNFRIVRQKNYFLLKN